MKYIMTGWRRGRYNPLSGVSSGWTDLVITISLLRLTEWLSNFGNLNISLSMRTIKTHHIYQISPHILINGHSCIITLMQSWTTQTTFAYDRHTISKFELIIYPFFGWMFYNEMEFLKTSSTFHNRYSRDYFSFNF